MSSSSSTKTVLVVLSKATASGAGSAPKLNMMKCERAYHWLDHGQWEAVARLKAGEPYAFTAAAGRTRVEWSARPVLFLPLAHAATGPPWRWAESALCSCTARGHMCRGYHR